MGLEWGNYCHFNLYFHIKLWCWAPVNYLLTYIIFLWRTYSNFLFICWVLFFLLLYWKFFYYITDMSPLSNICFTNIFVGFLETIWKKKPRTQSTNFHACYKAIIIKKIWHWCKDEHMKQWNSIGTIINFTIMVKLQVHHLII